MTSAWGKQVWNIPLNDPKYQVVAKMRHVFFLQPVPAGKKSVVGDSWQSISKQLQDRLRNADKQPQDNNPWFNKSWTAAKSLCSEDGISSQGSGMLDSSGGEGVHDKTACTMRKHSFPLYNSLLLINAFLQTASSLDEIYKMSINKNDCFRKQTKGNCEMLGRILATPDAWFKLNKDEKDRLKKISGVGF